MSNACFCRLYTLYSPFFKTNKLWMGYIRYFCTFSSYMCIQIGTIVVPDSFEIYTHPIPYWLSFRFMCILNTYIPILYCVHYVWRSRTTALNNSVECHLSLYLYTYAYLQMVQNCIGLYLFCIVIEANSIVCDV